MWYREEQMGEIIAENWNWMEGNEMIEAEEYNSLKAKR